MTTKNFEIDFDLQMFAITAPGTASTTSGGTINDTATIRAAGGRVSVDGGYTWTLATAVDSVWFSGACESSLVGVSASGFWGIGKSTSRIWSILPSASRYSLSSVHRAFTSPPEKI